MEPWKVHVTAAQTDIQAAFIGIPEQIAGHLKDAQKNLDKAIESLEKKEPEPEPVKSSKGSIKG